MVLIYLITKHTEATEISHRLINARLANSINIVPQVRTITWNGTEAEEVEDAVVLIKTKALLYSKVEKFVRERLKADDLAIFSVPMTQINPEYQDLLRKDTQPV